MAIMSRIDWRQFAFGVGTALVTQRYARPLAVGVVKSGLSVIHEASTVYGEARKELAKGEAASTTGGSSSSNAEILAELRSLRNEINDIKSGLSASKKS